MINEEKTFNINSVLQKLFLNVKETAKAQHTELIYEMDTTVPKEIRGYEDTFVLFLTALLTYALENMHSKEIVLYMSAPKDFFYEDPISFKINNSKELKYQLLEFMKKSLPREMEKLGVEIIDEDKDFKIAMPFRLHELGFRRHYRLSDKSMIDKNVLIVCESTNILTSLKAYFEYFHHHVDTSQSDEGFDLSKYDILVTEDKSVTSVFKNRIIEAHNTFGLKCVWIGEPHTMGEDRDIVSASLQKPITQEKIWILVESLFNPEIKDDVIKNYSVGQNMMNNCELTEEIEQIEKRPSTILNIESGDDNSKKEGLKFSEELKRFVEVFDRSDLYFRQIVSQKEYSKVERFCKDLLHRSELIGAEKVHQLMEIVKLVLQHEQYDMLPMYPGKYHAEFIQLKEKIDYFLKG